MQPYTRRRLVKDFAMIIGVLLLPLLVYIHLFFSEEIVSLNFLFFRIESGDFTSIHVALWVLSMKLIPVISFLLWRSTLISWWRNILLLPVLFFVWQISSVLDTDKRYFNDFKDFYLVLLLIIIALLIVIKIFLNFKTFINRIETSKAINNEIEEMLNQVSISDKNLILKIQNEFKSLQLNKNEISESEYLKRLLILKSRLDF